MNFKNKFKLVNIVILKIGGYHEERPGNTVKTIYGLLKSDHQKSQKRQSNLVCTLPQINTDVSIVLAYHMESDF